jgi:hypothetical protein
VSLDFADFDENPRRKALLDHFSFIEDPRWAWRAHPLPLVVCGMMADCDDFDGIASGARSIWRFCVAIWPTHLVSAFPTAGRLVLGQEPVDAARPRSFPPFWSFSKGPPRERPLIVSKITTRAIAASSRGSSA